MAKTPQGYRDREDVLRERTANSIWVYFQANKNTLDSERACAAVRKVIDDCVAEATMSVEEITRQMEDMKLELARLRKRLKNAKKPEPKVIKWSVRKWAQSRGITSCVLLWDLAIAEEQLQAGMTLDDVIQANRWKLKSSLMPTLETYYKDRQKANHA